MTPYATKTLSENLTLTFNPSFTATGDLILQSNPTALLFQVTSVAGASPEEDEELCLEPPEVLSINLEAHRLSLPPEYPDAVWVKTWSEHSHLVTGLLASGAMGECGRRVLPDGLVAHLLAPTDTDPVAVR